MDIDTPKNDLPPRIELTEELWEYILELLRQSDPWLYNKVTSLD